jgi:hypothetical protein
MTSYPLGGHHADDIGTSVRRALGTAGAKATMPKTDPGAVKGDELALVLAWADAFDRAKKAGVARPPSKPHRH